MWAVAPVAKVYDAQGEADKAARRICREAYARGGTVPYSLGRLLDLKLSLKVIRAIVRNGGRSMSGWKWMTHPSHNNGHAIPVRLVRDTDGTLLYQPFDTDATTFEWKESDKEWTEVAGPQAVVGVAAAEPWIEQEVARAAAALRDRGRQ